jgi:histidyl-tRNA synthetase
LPGLRGGPEVLDEAPGVGGLRSLYGQLEARGVADRVIFDLGLVRELGYYTGAVFEVYDPAVGFNAGRRRPLRQPDRQVRARHARLRLAVDVAREHLAQAAEEALS